MKKHGYSKKTGLRIVDGIVLKPQDWESGDLCLILSFAPDLLCDFQLVTLSQIVACPYCNAQCGRLQGACSPPFSSSPPST